MANILGIRHFALAGVLLAVVVVVLGAFTRLVDAGLGCPDWPGCYGHLTWPTNAQEIQAAERAFPDAPVELSKTWPEMVHRYFAGGLLLLVLGLTVYSICRQLPGYIKELSCVLLVLILCQAAFGAWTVTLKLWPQVVTAHLLGGFATLSLLWTLFIRSGGGSALQLNQSARDQLRGHRFIALTVVIVQIALGGWVSSNYAALACPYFPTCIDSYWPTMDLASGFNIWQRVGPNYLGGLLDGEARIAIHWVHRLGALVVVAVLLPLAWRLKAHNGLLAGILVVVVGLQVTLGILNIVWTLPLSIATAHNACGALLLLVVVTLNFAPAHERTIIANTTQQPRHVSERTGPVGGAHSV